MPAGTIRKPRKQKFVYQSDSFPCDNIFSSSSANGMLEAMAPLDEEHISVRHVNNKLLTFTIFSLSLTAKDLLVLVCLSCIGHQA